MLVMYCWMNVNSRCLSFHTHCSHTLQLSTSTGTYQQDISNTRQIKTAYLVTINWQGQVTGVDRKNRDKRANWYYLVVILCVFNFACILKLKCNAAELLYI